jgi:endonuclease YncB( thermonuclease family)
VSIADGDTIRVEIAGVEYPLRYIGIDTAEAEFPCADEATDANRQLVSGASVLLERDVSDTDTFRRFAVVPPDPHGFDADGDGIGCESG